MPAVDLVHHQGGSAEFLELDLASLESAKKAASAVASSGRTLDVLINNAGVGGVRGVTDDGYEMHFGVNHLGHFMLTHHLAKAFRPGTRIVVVSSEAHRRAHGIDFTRVQEKTRPLGRFSQYAVSKLANILFARRLAQLEPELRVYALHPGVADTNIFPPLAKPFFRNMKTPEQAAATSVWCATDDDLASQTGLYYSQSAVREPSATARNDILALELWRNSEIWCGVDRRD